jgi:hypothetical protein
MVATPRIAFRAIHSDGVMRDQWMAGQRRACQFAWELGIHPLFSAPPTEQPEPPAGFPNEMPATFPTWYTCPWSEDAEALRHMRTVDAHDNGDEAAATAAPPTG